VSAVPYKAADRHLGPIPLLAATLVEERQVGKIRHGFADLLGQRIDDLSGLHRAPSP
jgi:hypothetical protein